MSIQVTDIMKKEFSIRSGRLGLFDSSAARYASSANTDPKILNEVVQVNCAHVVALAKQGTIESKTAASLLSALRRVPDDLKLSEELEDVHASVEDYVTRKTGTETGGWLNLAKSRNDQVAAALRMALRSKLISIGKQLAVFETTLAEKAKENAGVIMPGYTHLQRAQPITVGHHLLAYSEMLARSSERIEECYARLNRSPMGAAALASSSFNPDRKLVAALLGFEGLVENSLDAVSSRDFAIETIYICAQIMSDISRLAEEIVIWTSSEFSFATIADAFASTSSIMPQKKNPIVPEIARAKSSQVSGDLVAGLGILKSLPLSYNLDLQELTKNLWSATEATLETISIFSELVHSTGFDIGNLESALEEDESIFSTELADYLVRKFRLPFRTAHQRVAAFARNAGGKHTFSSASESKLRETLGVAITKKEIRALLNPSKVLSSRVSVGSPNPKLVRKAAEKTLAEAKRFSRLLLEKEERLRKSEEALSREIDRLGSGKKDHSGVN